MKISQKILSLLLCLVVLFTAGSLAADAAVTKPGVTANFVAETTADSVELRWRKVSGATGYRVYQRVGNKWKHIKSTTTNKYILDDLTASETYKFAVRAYKKSGGKVYLADKYKSITAKTQKMGKTPTPKASKITKDSITLKWSKVAGASGYRVYQYKGGEWVKIKSVTTNTYTVTKLKSATTYKFRIKPYAKPASGTVWAATSSTLSVKTTDPTKTKITYAAVTDTTVTLKWSKVSSATGYRLSVLEKNGEWKRITSIPDLEYTVKKLKPNTEYTYMVKAYKKVNGKVTWYPESDAKKVKTTKAPEVEEPTEPTTKPTTTKPTTTKLTTTKPTTTEPTTTKPTTTKPTTTEPTTTKPTTTKPTTTKPTTTEPTTTKPTTTKPTTTEPTTTKPTTTKPTTTKPTTTINPDYELKAFRIEKYKKIFESDTLYFKISSDNGNGGLAKMEYAKKNGNIYVDATDEGINAKMYYEKNTDKMFAYFLLFYYEVPKAEWDEMDINEPLDEMKIQNVGNFITVTETVFNGKNVICEGYIDAKYGYIVKYYFDGAKLVGLEKVYKNETKQIIYVEDVRTSVDDSLLQRPLFGYVDAGGIMS